MPRCRIAKLRVAWIVGGCTPIVRTIPSNVRFHSITGSGTKGIGAAVVVGVPGVPAGEGLELDGACARAAGTATMEARSPARTDSLRSFIGYLSMLGWGAVGLHHVVLHSVVCSP